jgi:hypothetical protein
MLVVLEARFAARDPDRTPVVPVWSEDNILQPRTMAWVAEQATAPVLDPVMNLAGFWDKIATAALHLWLRWQELL